MNDKQRTFKCLPNTICLSQYHAL